MPAKFVFDAGTNLPEIREDVASELAIITRHISPLLLELGYPDDLKVVTNPKHSHQEEALLGNSATLNGALPIGTETALVVDTPGGSNFAIGDEIQFEGSNEIMIVVAPAPTPTVITVTRAQKGTPNTPTLDNTVLKRIAKPVTDDVAAGTGTNTNRVPVINYTQIFERTASVTRTMMKSDILAGVDDELQHQIDNHMKDLTRHIAMSIIRGEQQTANPEGTSTQPRTMRGIVHSILNGADPSVIDALGGGLTEALLNDALQDMFTKGGNPNLIAAPPAQRKALSALMAGRQRFVSGEKTLGAVVEKFETDFGTLNILSPDIFIPGDKVLLLDTNLIRPTKLGEGGDPFEVDDIAKVGLTFTRQVVAEIGLEIKNAGDGGQGMIENLAA